MKVVFGVAVLVVGFLAIAWVAVGQHVYSIGLNAINGLSTVGF